MYITELEKKYMENILKIVKQSDIWQIQCLILLLSARTFTWTCNATSM